MNDAIARSQDAQRLLDDPLLKEAFEAIDKSILERLRGKATPEDAELLMMLRVLAKLKATIHGWAQSGKVELHEREQELSKGKPNG